VVSAQFSIFGDPNCGLVFHSSNMIGLRLRPLVYTPASGHMILSAFELT